MIFLKKKLRNRGFTLIEVLLAVTVFSIGIIGSYNIIAYNISNFSKSINRVIASNLAQEGFELVRNIRDSNWLSGADWDNNLVGGVGNFRQIKFFCGGVENQNINPAPAGSDDCSDDVNQCEDAINNCSDNNCRVQTYTVGAPPSFKCYSDNFGAKGGYNSPEAKNFYRLIILDKIANNSIKATVVIKWSDRSVFKYLTAQEILYNWK